MFGTHQSGAQADHAMEMSNANMLETQDFQREMRATQYQTATQDMIKAGLNPMLAYSQGGAGTPSGGSATGGQIGGVQNYSNVATQLATAAQIENIHADTAKKGAEAKNTEAQTTLVPIQADAMRAQIAGTIQTIEESKSRINLNVSTAAQADQNVINARAMLKQIDATVDQLKAQTKATAAQVNLTEAETRNMNQLIAANLPKIEAAQKSAQEFLLRMQQPEAMNQAGLHQSFLGAVSTLLQAFNPLRGFMH